MSPAEIAALVAAITSLCVALAPHIYRFVSGRAALMKAEHESLAAERDRVEAGMQARLDAYRLRLDAAEDTIRKHERAIGECEARDAAKAERIAFLEEEVKMLRDARER